MIAPKKIDEIVKKIAISCKPEKIIIFGSYAYGYPSENSDLDLLVVVKDDKQPRHKRARGIRKNLWGMTDISKDIIVYTQDEINEWKEVEEAFITSVMRRGKVVYENKKGLDK